MMRNEIDMLKGKILTGMLVFTFPLIISNLLQLLFNMADLAIVGRFASDACMGAVSATSFIIQVITSIFIGVSIGVNVLVARLIGEVKREEISKVIHTSLSFAIIMGIILTVFGYSTANLSLRLTSCPEDLLDLATTYLKIYYLGMPGVLIYNYGAAILRAKGDTKRPLYYLLLSGVVNVILNIVLIVFFGMDVDGVAIATVVSQYLSMILIMIILFRERDEFRFSLNKLNIDAGVLKETLKLGIPAGIQSCLFSISNLVLQVQINSFGSTVVTAMGAAHTLESLCNCVVQGVTLGAMTYVSQNYGARNYKRIKESIVYALLIGFVWSTVLTLFGMYLGDFYMSIYSSDPAIIEAGFLKIKYSMCLYESYMLMQTGASLMRGLGHSKQPTILCLLGVCGVRILYVYTIFQINPIIENILITYPLSWIVSCLLIWPPLLKELKRVKKNLLIS